MWTLAWLSPRVSIEVGTVIARTCGSKTHLMSGVTVLGVKKSESKPRKTLAGRSLLDAQRNAGRLDLCLCGVTVL